MDKAVTRMPRGVMDYKVIMSKSLFLEPNNVREALVYDPAFQLSSETGLCLKPAQGYEIELANQLSAMVSADPQNLKVHIRRICLYFDLHQADFLFGALIDLWIAFNGRGRDFFRIILFATKVRLKEEDFKQLHKLFVNKELSASKTPSARLSVLSQGLSGSLKLVSLVDDNVASQQQRDPLVEALEYLEYSQVEQALSVLEVAVMIEPTRKDLQQHLLEIYLSTLDLHGLKEMEKKLKNHLFQPMEWDLAANKILEAGEAE